MDGDGVYVTHVIPVPVGVEDGAGEVRAQAAGHGRVGVLIAAVISALESPVAGEKERVALPRRTLEGSAKLDRLSAEFTAHANQVGSSDEQQEKYHSMVLSEKKSMMFIVCSLSPHHNQLPLSPARIAGVEVTGGGAEQ